MPAQCWEYAPMNWGLWWCLAGQKTWAGRQLIDRGHYSTWSEGGFRKVCKILSILYSHRLALKGNLCKLPSQLTVSMERDIMAKATRRPR